jgi:hypothetical protein
VVLLAVVLLLDGGAPRGSDVDLPPSSGWRFCGTTGRDFPLPDSVVRWRIWQLLKISTKKLGRLGSATTASFGVGPSGPAIGDFPLARGLPSIQGVKEGRSDGAPPTALGTTMWSSCRRAGLYFLFSVGTFL